MTETWVLVCGGRDYGLKGELFLVMDHLHALHNFTFLVHGDASGADRLAGEWAKERGVQQIKVPANWEGNKKAAGPLRNQLMLDLFNPDIVVAFPGGTGTADMLWRAYETECKVILAPEEIDIVS